MTKKRKATDVTVIDEDGDTLLVLKDPFEQLNSWETSDIDYTSDPEPASGTQRAKATRRGPQRAAKATQQVHFQVSSSQLKNASKYFRNMLSGGFSESIVSPHDGKYHITVEGFNTKALEHVMNIIHVKTKRLPKTMDLELLAHIAVLIDYYDMKDAVSFHADVWTKAVARRRFPTTYCRDVVLRTFVARIFGDKRNFIRGAQVIMRDSEGTIQDFGLPMFGLAELLDERRRKAIQAVIDHIKQLPDELADGHWACSYGCRAMLLGHFMTTCCAFRLTGGSLGIIEAPFSGLSYSRLSSSLENSWYPPTWYNRDDYMAGSGRHKCDLGDFVDAALEAGKQVLKEELEE